MAFSCFYCPFYCLFWTWRKNTFKCHSKYLEASAGAVQNAVVQAIMWVLKQHITPLLCELYWLPVCLWVQFKVLILTFKVLNNMRLCYLRYFLSLVASVHPGRDLAVGMLWVPLARDIHLVDPRRNSLSAMATTLWNVLPPEIRLAPSLFISRPELTCGNMSCQ